MTSDNSRTISKAAGGPLKWTQPGTFKKWYELRAGEDLVGTLRFRSMFGSFATGESADGCWTMKRSGMWRPRATVRACDSEVDIASFKDNTWSSGGTLTLADGRQLSAVTGFWKSKFKFLDEQRNDLISFNLRGVLHESSEVDIQPRARTMAELPWMVMFGWYLTVQKHEEESIAASAASA